MRYYIKISKRLTREQLIKIFTKYGANERTNLSIFAGSLLTLRRERIFLFNVYSNGIIGAAKNDSEFTYSWFFGNYSDAKLIVLERKPIKYNRCIP